MPTISAYTSDELKRKIDQITREEGRKQAQVGNTALELYAALPPAARRAFLEVCAVEEELPTGALDRVIAEVSRALLNAKWEVTSARIGRELRERGTLPERDFTEDEIAELAVQMADRGVPSE
jgi:hypothetical protein